jgi:hypothetical protein
MVCVQEMVELKREDLVRHIDLLLKSEASGSMVVVLKTELGFSIGWSDVKGLLLVSQEQASRLFAKKVA